jgi:DNA-binding protein Fis
VLVDSLPQAVFLADDAGHNLVEMLFVSWSGQTPADLISKALAELESPLLDSFMAD